MSEKLTKLTTIPVDGSANSLKSVDYAIRFFRDDHPLKIQLLYILPSPPPLLVEESRQNRDTAVMLKKLGQKNMAVAEKAITEAQDYLLGKGFDPDKVNTLVYRQAPGIARGICTWAEDHAADAIVMSSRGLSRLESFFMGATAGKVVDGSAICPVWLIKGSIQNDGVLMAIDDSQNTMRALDHAGFMLSGTDFPIILFHSIRNLMCFMPREVTENSPQLEAIWQDRAAKQIAPIMEKARHMLEKAGVNPSRIQVRVSEGTSSAAADILKAARKNGCGTIIMGRRGLTGFQAFAMGSVSRNVIQQSENVAVWIVP